MRIVVLGGEGGAAEVVIERVDGLVTLAIDRVSEFWPPRRVAEVQMSDPSARRLAAALLRATPRARP